MAIIHPRCKLCAHPERTRIEMLRTSGVPLDDLARDFGLHRDAIWRHCERHMSEATKVRYLAGPARVEELAKRAAEEGKSVLDYLGVIRATLVGQLDRLATKGDAYGVALISSRLLETLKQIGHISGEIGHLASVTNISVTTNNIAIVNSAPFVELQAGLLKVCQAHPEARADIVRLFHELDQRHAQPQQIEGVAAHG